MNILEILKPYINNDYKKFHTKICQTKYEILGIKIPTLRKIAKELVKKYDYLELLNNINNDYYECVMLKGLIIGNIKISFEERIKLINEFLPLIDNWAICDIFISELKFIKKEGQKFLEYIKPFKNETSEYYLRFYIVSLLDYYINDKYIDYVLENMLNIKSDYYYVKMAISWCLSVCLVKHFDKTLEFLNINKERFDKWTYNKALQKGMESFRISTENKKLLKSMKI